MAEIEYTEENPPSKHRWAIKDTGFTAFVFYTLRENHIKLRINDKFNSAANELTIPVNQLKTVVKMLNEVGETIFDAGDPGGNVESEQPQFEFGDFVRVDDRGGKHAFIRPARDIEAVIVDENAFFYYVHRDMLSRWTDDHN